MILSDLEVLLQQHSNSVIVSASVSLSLLTSFSRLLHKIEAVIIKLRLQIGIFFSN